MKENKFGYTAADLQKAAQILRELDPIELVGDFRKFKHGCSGGSYAALVLDPRTGETNTVNEVSQCCSTNEYFSESGIMSRTTLLSTTRAHWSPSPDDGFEWDYTNQTEGDYFVKKGDYSNWDTIENFEPEDGVEYEFFKLSDRPVDGWVPEGQSDYDVRELQNEINELADSMDSEAEGLKCEEDEI